MTWRIRARAWRAGALLLVTLAIPLQLGAASAPKLSQVYLVQTSGWMEPFYADQGSQFRAVIVSLIQNTRLKGVKTVVATFNQDGQIPGHTSPEPVFVSDDIEGVARAVEAIEPPRRPDGKYADSDFFGALNGTIGNLLFGRQAIIWMITNNKASPGNSQEVLENTRKFYDGLRTQEPIRKIIAFPIRMRVHGPHYDERGFIIYGIAYGEAAARALDVVTAEAAPLRKFFTAPPVRLKPLTREPLRLELSAQSQGSIVASLEDGILTLRGIPASGGETILTGDLTNTYYPQQVESAHLSVEASTAQGQTPFVTAIDPVSIRGLAPGAKLKGVRIGLRFAPVERGSMFDDHAQAEGQLLIKLSDANLDLAPEFIDRMRDVFAVDLLMKNQSQIKADGLPDLFFDFQKVRKTTTVIPVRLVYDFSPWPLVLSTLGAFFMLLVGGGGFFLLARPRKYTVRIGGSAVPVRLRPFERRIMQGGNQVRATVRGSLFGPPAVVEIKTAEEAV